MKLSKKTFLYSILIAGVLTGFVLIYFVCMLPSLYVDYLNKEDRKSVVKMEQKYMKTRDYDEINIKNPTGAVTLEIPFSGNEIYLAGKGFKFTVSTKDERILKELEKVRGIFRGNKDLMEVTEKDLDIWDFDALKEVLMPDNMRTKDYPIQFKADVDSAKRIYNNQSIRTYMISGILVCECRIEDESDQYTTYFAIGNTEDAAMISMLTVMTPQMKEIKVVVLQSMPMIVAVIFLLVLICSRYFSNKIVNPIIQLAGYAQQIQDTGAVEICPFALSQKDETGELGNALNELYQRLGKNYRELEEKNQMLKRENERREVFLRASSHQLKTPVAAALLLVDGMIDGVGKYRDTQVYLPQVKEKLFQMRDIVEDILYLNHCTENLQTEYVEMEYLAKEVLQEYDFQMEEKGIQVVLEDAAEGQKKGVETDHELLKKIVDNLVSNAVAYTPENGKIEVILKEKGMNIINYGGHIEEDILPHIMEPFVSSDMLKKGKGLGLYIASYYGEILGFKLTVENFGQAVCASLWKEE